MQLTINIIIFLKKFPLFLWTVMSRPVCLFGVLLSTQFIHSFGDVTIAGEGLQSLTYARLSWPFSSESS